MRLRGYLNINFLSREIRHNKSKIYRVLRKNKYENFSLEILEYCEPSLVIIKEQKYLDLLKPEYNILKIAGSMVGYKHSKKTLAKLKGRVLTLEQRVRQLEALKIVHANKEYQAMRLDAIMSYNSSEKSKIDRERLSHSVEVTDTLTNIKNVYSSKAEAGRAINCDKSTISVALKEFKDKGVYRLVKKRYLISLKEGNMPVQDEKSTVSNFDSDIPSQKKIKELNSKRVEIVDISTGNITIYLSLSEASKAIGCHLSTVSKAFKKLREKGVDSIVLKNRYKLIISDSD